MHGLRREVILMCAVHRARLPANLDLDRVSK